MAQFPAPFGGKCSEIFLSSVFGTCIGHLVLWCISAVHVGRGNNIINHLICAQLRVSLTAAMAHTASSDSLEVTLRHQSFHSSVF